MRYHVTSSANRESIQTHGLDWRLMSELPGIAGSERFEQPGVFLAETRDEADWFVEMAKERHPLVDIWSVTLDGIDGEETRIDGFLCWTAPIPRSHLELVEKDL